MRWSSWTYLADGGFAEQDQLDAAARLCCVCVCVCHGCSGGLSDGRVRRGPVGRCILDEAMRSVKSRVLFQQSRKWDVESE